MWSSEAKREEKEREDTMIQAGVVRRGCLRLYHSDAAPQMAAGISSHTCITGLRQTPATTVISMEKFN